MMAGKRTKSVLVDNLIKKEFVRRSEEPDQRPRCPKCGEPARTMSCLALVEVILKEDGTPDILVHRSRIRIISTDRDPVFFCGGGHDWTKEEQR